MSGLATTDSFYDKVQSEGVAVPTILAAVENSGAIDIILEESRQDDDSAVEAHGICQAEYRSNQYHQETQTEALFLSFADIGLHRKIDETRVNTGKCKARTCHMQSY